MNFDMVKHVAVEIQVFRDAEVFQHDAHIKTIVVEQQTVPALQVESRQVQAGRFAKMRRADQFTFEIVGPAMQRANDIGRIAATNQHFGLTVAANVGYQFDTRCAACQQTAIVFPRQ